MKGFHLQHLNVLVMSVLFTIIQNGFKFCVSMAKTKSTQIVSLLNYILFIHSKHGNLPNATLFY